MHSTPTSALAQTETEKFLAWHAAEKANGLMDTKFFTRDISMASVESFCSELNKLNLSEEVAAPDFI
jgi:hypothetical protein